MNTNHFGGTRDANFPCLVKGAGPFVFRNNGTRLLAISWHAAKALILAAWNSQIVFDANISDENFVKMMADKYRY